jgi:hypothetical protein
MISVVVPLDAPAPPGSKWVRVDVKSVADRHAASICGLIPDSEAEGGRP